MVCMENNFPYKIYSSSSEAWDAMFESISAAQKSIYWELYAFVDDEAGNRFFDCFESKAKSGVDVKIIIDSWGSYELSRKRIGTLRKAGVDIRMFQDRKKKNYRNFFQRFISRTHRKLLVIDEKIGFIGGVNIQKHMHNWLDIHVRIEGRSVRPLLKAFAKMYVICGGDKQKVAHLKAHPIEELKQMTAKVKKGMKKNMRKRLKKKAKKRLNSKHSKDIEYIFDNAHPLRSKARKVYTEALSKAKERVILFSPYYFPDKKFLFALWKARKRGVRVDLVIPFRTDVRVATYAAYTWYSLMKKYGVKVHVLKQMMHGKGVVVDDDWAMVGSSNIEHGSFYDNYEANIRLKNKQAVRKIKDILEGWIEKAQNLDEMNWDARGRWQKFKEWVAKKLYTSWHHRHYGEHSEIHHETKKDR